MTAFLVCLVILEGILLVLIARKLRDQQAEIYRLIHQIEVQRWGTR